MKKPAVDLSKFRRLAILMPNWLGDAVMAEPSIRAICGAAPSLELSLFGRASAISMLEGHPAISSFTAIDDQGILGPLASGRALRAAGADAVLLLRGSFRSGLGAAISRVRPRIGFARDARRALLTHPITPPARDRPSPTVDFYATLVESAFGITVQDRLPRLVTTPSEREAASRLLADIAGPIVGFVPGGSKLEKRWPMDRFVDLADRLGSDAETVVLLGGPDERDLLSELEANARNGSGPRVIDLASRGLGLDSLRGVIERCSAVVTNDTGPRHLAVALGIPTIALFGPTDHRWTTLRGARERILIGEPFLPEEQVADRYPKMCRVDRIPVGDVLHAVKTTLHEPRDAESVSSTT
ncbi:MAG: glycosyltransferase family 9 protein [Planctomycetota bacterium]|jgi:heptosyltransferase II|nr:glycosyltransferase family 9 protein [Planctomycetota bacterium]MDA1025572.1 glycosyltransferase family 9 protein [Planctomycetota bacterium]